MSTTLVGLFDDRAQARNACARLQGAGIDKLSIRLNGAAWGHMAAAQQLDRGREAGGLRRMFARMFGADEASACGADAVRAGRTVLTVVVADDRRVGEIERILAACGAAKGEARGEAGADERWPGDAGIGRGMPARRSAATQPPVHTSRPVPAGLQATPQFGDDAPPLDRLPAARAYAGPERRLRNELGYSGSERRWAA